ncbi:FAD-binding oxidoreductase [Speluncibacter jeojiensis]|uniref:FAD-binding oxidoreductase n=1 Tax=Speluncibacter jeojiensis TaxID=2710754 RepID=UPI0024103E25|nr:FAD-binding oxidoreductase [Rhodococcus sp. D2-41]
MAQHSSSPLLQLLSRLEAHSDQFTALFYNRLFAIDPPTRELFPVAMARQRTMLFRVLAHVIETIDHELELEELVTFLAQLGRDHRKYGVLPSHYESFGTALLWAMRTQLGPQWTPAMEAAAAQVVELTTVVMRSAAETEAQRLPAWWSATVVEHHRKTRDLAVVRVESDVPIPYQPGQYFSVEVPQYPRIWRFYSAAIPPNNLGQMEFHIRAVPGGSVSQAMVSSARYGDRWRIGAPHGAMEVDRTGGRDVVMVAGGTGLAPLRALIMDMCRFGENPRVHLFYGTRYPGELYDLDTLWELMRTNPWLSVTPVSEFDEDPWSLGKTADSSPFGLYLRQTGTLADVVCSYGRWSDRQILVCGSAAMVEATVEQMVANGTPRENIQHDPI